MEHRLTLSLFTTTISIYLLGFLLNTKIYQHFLGKFTFISGVCFMVICQGIFLIYFLLGNRNKKIVAEYQETRGDLTVKDARIGLVYSILAPILVVAVALFLRKLGWFYH